MENNKNKKSVKFQGDMLIFYDFIQVFVFTTSHHLKCRSCFGSALSSRKETDGHKIVSLFVNLRKNDLVPHLASPGRSEG